MNLRMHLATALLTTLLPMASMASMASPQSQSQGEVAGNGQQPSAPQSPAASALPGPPATTPSIDIPVAAAPPGNRTGLDIYRKFRDGLAEPRCEPGASARWRKHFAHVPNQLSSESSEVLPMFGYVVDALHDAYLPTEFALIPFVESGYKPGARSPSGPLGLWQFIAITARNHKVPMRAGYDGRLSPIDSTTAAVRYLKTLHGMFAGDWRLTAMAYNTGEHRVLGALRRSGQQAANADASTLAMPEITQAYVRKLHALSCLLAEMEDRGDWLQALDRPVPVLSSVAVAKGSRNLDHHARHTGVDAVLLKRLNPAFNSGFPGNPVELRVLSPEPAVPALLAARPSPPRLATTPPAPARAAGNEDISDAVAMAAEPPEVPKRTHIVARGESAWAIARRHGIRLDELLERNGLAEGSVLQPGMVLRIDPATGSP